MLPYFLPALIPFLALCCPQASKRSTSARPMPNGQSEVSSMRLQGVHQHPIVAVIPFCFLAALEKRAVSWTSKVNIYCSELSRDFLRYHPCAACLICCPWILLCSGSGETSSPLGRGSWLRPAWHRANLSATLVDSIARYQHYKAIAHHVSTAT